MMKKKVIQQLVKQLQKISHTENNTKLMYRLIAVRKKLLLYPSDKDILDSMIHFDTCQHSTENLQEYIEKTKIANKGDHHNKKKKSLNNIQNILKIWLF